MLDNGSKQIKIIFIVNYIFIIAPTLAIFAGTRFFGYGLDFKNYILLFTTNQYKAEPIFTILSYINRKIFPNSIVFVFSLCAYVGLLLKMGFFIQYSKDFLCGILFYLITLYFLHEYTQVRASIGLGICFLATKDIANKNFKNFFLKILFAFLFHKSAILFLLVYFFIQKIEKVGTVVIICWLCFLLAFIISILLHGQSFLSYLLNKQPILKVIIDKGGSLSPCITYSVFNITYFLIMFITTIDYLFDSKFDFHNSRVDITIKKMAMLSPISYYLLINLGLDVLTFRISEMFIFYFISVLVGLYNKFKYKVFYFPIILLVVFNMTRVFYKNCYLELKLGIL